MIFIEKAFQCKEIVHLFVFEFTGDRDRFDKNKFGSEYFEVVRKLQATLITARISLPK